MKVSLNWLNKYVDLSGIDPQSIADALTMLGIEVENIETYGLKKLDNVVVGEILSRQDHPDSDHLGVCSVKVSQAEPPLQIVCGASNYKVGDRVPVALVGAKLPSPDGKVFEIKKSKLRGVESCGMMCSGREIGLDNDHSGLLILQDRPEIGTPINDVFTDSDTVFEIELTANRGDCLSHIGMARELAARFGKELRYPELKYSPKYVEIPDGGFLNEVKLETPNCPLYTAVSIKGVKIGKSPDWMRRELEAVGLRSINNVVDVTNYVMMEYGQPLHSFDARLLKGGKIIVRQAREGEEIQTLDEKIYKLTGEAMLICNADSAIGIAGVMGGLNSEVKDDTQDVVIESAYFNPGNVRATSRKYGISTDAAYRFARDVDPKALLDASRRAVDLILETAGGEVVGSTCKVGAAPRGDRDIEISRAYIIDRLGFEVGKDDISKAFSSLGFIVKNLGEEKWSITVPSFRSEVDRPIDLVEEFVRIWGSDKIPDTDLNCAALLRDDDPLFKYNRNAANYLSSIGLNECQNYTLRDSQKQAKIHSNSDFLKLANPLTSDQDSLRASLLDGILDVVKYNLSNGNDFYGFFENGKIFKADKNGEINEYSSTAFAIAADCGGRNWKSRQAPDFFTAKKIAFDLLSVLGVDASRLNLSELESPLWQSGFAAACGSEKREGFCVNFGAVSVAHLRELGIDKIVLAGEISFRPEVAGRKKGAEKFKAFSAFPPAVRDIAIIADKNEKASEIANEITRIAKQKLKGASFELENLSIFDSYEGKGVAEGSKSLGFALSFRSSEKTLQTEEVNKVFDAICQELSKKRKLRIA